MLPDNGVEVDFEIDVLKEHGVKEHSSNTF
jgi:hypothetical protein